MTRRIACKFGGTSLADADNIRRVAALVEADPQRRFIVVSAPGKRHPKDKKITDLLLLLHETARNGLDFTSVLAIIRARFEEIRAALKVSFDLESEFAEIVQRVPLEESRDYAASRGEFLNGKLIASFLGAHFVDPAENIFFNEAGNLDEARTYPALAASMSGAGRFLVPGFYGLDVAGRIKTFPRGGSDITGAIVARAVEADVYENWTDVGGLLMADPSIIKDAMPMREVTYLELRELSYMGAQVLHDEAVFPVRDPGIPINIRNTFDPDNPGTRIVPSRDPGGQPVVGIAGRKDFSAIHMSKAMMNRERGFGRRVLEIVESYGLSFEHMPTGIDSLSLIIRTADLKPHRRNLIKDIQGLLKVDILNVFDNLALIAVVGTGMAYHCGIASRIFTTLSDAGINIRLIDQGASELTIIIGVENRDFENGVRSIYKAFAPS